MPGSPSTPGIHDKRGLGSRAQEKGMTQQGHGGQAVGAGGEEAKIWHRQLLQCLVLPKGPGLSAGVGGRVKGTRGPVRGADLSVLARPGQVCCVPRMPFPDS